MTEYRDLKEYPYFIYRHLREDSGIPFYIGRGKAKFESTSVKKIYSRAFDKCKRSTIWKRIASKHGYIVEIMMDNLTFEEVNVKEIEFIKMYGRHKKGLLCNLTDGGEGSVNFKHSEKTIEFLKTSKSVSMDVILTKFIDKTDHDCWIWKGSIARDKARIHYNGKGGRAQRVIYEYFNNKLKRNQHVHNNCKNCLCVNPEHLVVHRASVGSRNKSKFKESDIKEIKRLANNGYTHKSIANMYNVSRVLITKIIRGYKWGWVDSEYSIPDKNEYHSKKKKPVLCVETGEIFPSAKEASLIIFQTIDNYRYIRKICNSNKYTYCKGFNFRFI